MVTGVDYYGVTAEFIDMLDEYGEPWCCPSYLKHTRNPLYRTEKMGLFILPYLSFIQTVRVKKFS